MTLNERMDRMTEKADSLPQTGVTWDADAISISVSVSVWTRNEGDVENRLAGLLRRVADEMEVSRP